MGQTEANKMTAAPRGGRRVPGRGAAGALFEMRRRLEALRRCTRAAGADLTVGTGRIHAVLGENGPASPR